MTLVLASRSPARRAILERLGVNFIVRPSDVEELEQGEPLELARENALCKATAVAPAHDQVVLGVDTIVALDGVIYGKPQSATDVALLRAGAEPLTLTESTAVSFRELDEPMIAWYLKSDEWQGRSGGYAIQQAGGALVRRIEGDYTNVVGLPVGALIDAWPWLIQ